MASPEKLPPSQPADLRPAQVPWGARKKPAKPAEPVVTPVSIPPAEPAPAPPPSAPAVAPVVATLSARKVPWGARKAAPAAPPPPSPDAMVTHMPWAEPPPPAPPPPAPKKSLLAKLVPWGSRKTPPPPPPPEDESPDEIAAAPVATWALPKSADTTPATQEEMDFARELRGTERSGGEPTAEQLVALLSRLPVRTKKGAPTMLSADDARTPYKARPISFEPTRWEIFKMWAVAYRRRLSVASVLLILALATAYLWRLVTLNAEIDRQWRVVESALRDRYALAPAYVDCITVFSDSERYTMTITEHGLKAWRSARTDHQVSAAAARMETVLTLLAKVMRRYDQAVPIKEGDEADASVQFARLERQRESSRQRTAELVQRYNATVENFNHQIDSMPGSWLAWASNLHEHSLMFARAR